MLPSGILSEATRGGWFSALWVTSGSSARTRARSDIDGAPAQPGGTLGLEIGNSTIWFVREEIDLCIGVWGLAMMDPSRRVRFPVEVDWRKQLGVGNRAGVKCFGLWLDGASETRDRGTSALECSVRRPVFVVRRNHLVPETWSKGTSKPSLCSTNNPVQPRLRRRGGSTWTRETGRVRDGGKRGQASRFRDNLDAGKWVWSVWGVQVQPSPAKSGRAARRWLGLQSRPRHYRQLPKDQSS